MDLPLDLSLTSVIVPIYNEMHRLPSRVSQILGLVDLGAEVLLVDDGSDDGSGPYIDRIAGGLTGVRVLHLPENRGKGAAVRLGVAFSSREVIVFMDADLATDLSDLGPLISALEDHEVAIGSRAAAAAVLGTSSLRRQLMGGAFNQAVRALTGLPFKDTQCGFKAFRAPFAKVIFAASTLDGFAFDVEILLLTSRLGGRIMEVPVHWHEVAGSHIHPASDAVGMLRDVVRARKTSRVATTLLVVRLPHESSADLHNMVVATVGHPAFAGSTHLLFVYAGQAEEIHGLIHPRVAEIELESMTAEHLVSMIDNS